MRNTDRNTFTARGIPATWRVAAHIAAMLPKGGVLALQGELGAGKTTFVQGLARALGIRRPVTSPTFTLVSEYTGGALRLVHMDLYRLRDPDDLLAIGFHDYLDRGSLVAVEWPERAGDLLPADTLWVSLTLVSDPRTRRIRVQPRRQLGIPSTSDLARTP
jgi:tRNA threonylcarbamoyladenosine biosynthesis protein TsaE